MVYGCIKLAGIPIGVSCQYPCTLQFCGAYQWNGTPEIEIILEQKDLEYEQHVSQDGQTWSLQYLEHLALLRKICDRIAGRGVLLMHASAVEIDGKAVLFTARSGTGKSTHARLWRETLPQMGHSVRMINDDKPFLRFDDSGIRVCGTPWTGKHKLGANLEVPLHAVGQICRSFENAVTRLEKDSIWPLMASQIYLSANPDGAKRVLAMMDRLRREIPFFRISCNMQPEAALTSYSVLCNKEQEGE